MSDQEEPADQALPSEPEPEAPLTVADSDQDPIDEALYTSFMQATATGADASQAFNVGVYAANQAAMEQGIPEMVFEQIASDLFGPYSAALGEGHSAQESLRIALQTLEE